MGTRLLLLSVLIGCCLASPQQPTERPHGGICSNQSDCRRDECCVITNMRYSYPTCQRFVRAGGNCRPYDLMDSGRLRFPDGSIFDYTNAYVSVCPCERNLVCNRRSGVCERT